MPIDRTAAAARALNRAPSALKPISELDPDNTSREECEAALGAIYGRYIEYKTAARQPKLFKVNNDDHGPVILSIMGNLPDSVMNDPTAMYTIGKTEGLFLGELLAPIPLAERPMKSGAYYISSPKTLATAIKIMAETHQWQGVIIPSPAAILSR
jgi:hypothetical protein